MKEMPNFLILSSSTRQPQFGGSPAGIPAECQNLECRHIQAPEGLSLCRRRPGRSRQCLRDPEKIKAAVVQSGPEDFLEQLGLKRLEEFGSYRLPR
jgi:hypothetical protein